ncbi:MAG: hypothetical protein Q4G46_00165 [Propionibacteriaceae bacterium]|nr:hypothetical protein [Propionibacteriaceae bacterium]
MPRPAYTYKMAIENQAEAARDARQALWKADNEIRAIERRQDMYPGEKAARQKEIRDRLAQELDAARAELATAQKAARDLARPVTAAPDADTIARLGYYRQQAEDAMRGQTASGAVVLAQKALETGDKDRARAFVEAARPLAEQSRDWHPRWNALNRATEPKEDRVQRELTAAAEGLEYRVGMTWEAHLEELERKCGVVHQDVKDGLRADEGMDLRRLDLLADNIPQMAADLLNAQGDDSGQDGGEAA